MIRISILYPNRADAWFDLDYYLNIHIPMVLEKLGGAIKGVDIDDGVSGASQGSQPPFFVIGHFLAESIQAYQDALEPHHEALAEDIENFTNLEPLIQYSQIRFSSA